MTLLRFCALPLLALAVAVLPAPLRAQSANTLMPQPAHLSPGSGSLPLSSSFTYALEGNTGPRLSAAAQRLVARIELRTGLVLAKSPVSGPATLTISVPAAPDTLPQPGIDESYTLDIDSSRIALSAHTGIGALRGLETLLQLVQPAGSGFVFPAIHIEDAPRFPWRGLMLDSGRHFLPLPVIFRTLNGMASVKLNVFHWHLTEDQGFRVESKLYPKLHQLGSNGQFYTQDQVREVVAYASARGIRVVPEFDIPGHTQSWFVGHPELASGPGPYVVDSKFGISDAAMDPTRESTFEFLDRFLGEMASLFPDPYMHIGGDESNGKEWLANPAIVAFMQSHNFKTTAELQTYFSQRIQKILSAHGKQMVGWDEILSPNLPADAAIQVWHGGSFLADAVRQNHRVLLSQPYYLDHIKPAETMYLADPMPDAGSLSSEQQKLFLGGEICMWGEHVDASTIDSRIWPRSAAIAERLWSPASTRDVNDLYRRLPAASLRLESEGLQHLSGPERILRLEAGSAQIQPLALFLSTLQPLDFGARNREQRPNTFTVLNRLIDAARPDPALRHDLPLWVDAALQGDAAARARLRSLFQSWADAAPALQALEAASPILQEAHAHIAAWPQLAALGLDALQALDTRTPPPAGWLDRQNQILHDAVHPHDLVDFVVLPPLQKLAEAAAALPPSSATH